MTQLYLLYPDPGTKGLVADHRLGGVSQRSESKHQLSQHPPTGLLLTGWLGLNRSQLVTLLEGARLSPYKMIISL